jgi:aminoglycoside phosphotransferase (APT) family kinase protein
MDRAPLDSAEIQATVVETGHQVGLDTRNAELIKFTNNAVLRLPQASVVLRIAGSAVIGARAERVVRAARLLAGQGVPAVRLWAGSDHPILVRGHEITIWDDVRTVRPTRAEDLAGLLRAVHAVPAVPAALPSWEPISGIRQRIATVATVGSEALAFLRSECDAVAAELLELDDVEPLLPRGLVHGDAFLGNVIVGPAGPVLCDFDSTSWGPREWDLTPVAVGARRFRDGADLQRRLVRSYGTDVTGWKGFRTLRRLRELQLVTSVLPVLEANPRLQQQWRLRLDSLRRKDDDARWTTYAELAG